MMDHRFIPQTLDTLQPVTRGRTYKRCWWQCIRAWAEHSSKSRLTGTQSATWPGLEQAPGKLRSVDPWAHTDGRKIGCTSGVWAPRRPKFRPYVRSTWAHTCPQVEPRLCVLGPHIGLKTDRNQSGSVNLSKPNGMRLQRSSRVAPSTYKAIRRCRSAVRSSVVARKRRRFAELPSSWAHTNAKFQSTEAFGPTRATKS